MMIKEDVTKYESNAVQLTAIKYYITDNRK